MSWPAKYLLIWLAFMVSGNVINLMLPERLQWPHKNSISSLVVGIYILTAPFVFLYWICTL
jgi:hypothetical protein